MEYVVVLGDWRGCGVTLRDVRRVAERRPRRADDAAAIEIHERYVKLLADLRRSNKTIAAAIAEFVTATLPTRSVHAQIVIVMEQTFGKRQVSRCAAIAAADNRDSGVQDSPRGLLPVKPGQ